ncbi:Peroxidasin [Echinococcus granulosus]|nr:Peroxidasin [Echinococcus granulosus]
MGVTRAAVAFIWLGLLTLFCTSTCQDACPGNCVCFSQSIVCRRSTETIIPKIPAFLDGPQGGALQYFAITNTKLSRVPTEAFVGLLDIMSIDLSNNEIEVIEEGAFQDLPILAHLLLRQNRLTQLPDNIFDTLPSLEELDLSFNQLTTIPSSLQRMVGLKSLSLRGNPLHCGCGIVDFAQLLPYWESSLDRVTCATPAQVAGKSIKELGRQYFQAFEGTRHLGHWPDEYAFPEEISRKQLIRTRTPWPLPHCPVKDLGGEVVDNVDSSTGSYEAPQIIEAPVPVMVAEGERVFFVCQATGVPRPKISWILPTNNSQHVHLWDKRKILELREVHAYHEGTYTCVAKNQVGQVSHSVMLQLVDIVKPQITDAPSTKATVGEPGGDIELTCTARGRPRPTVDWLYTHTSSAKRLSTQGRYVVRSSAKLSTRTIQDLTYRDFLAQTDESLRLEGEEESVTLTIRNVTELDTEGRYTCYAANRAGSTRVTSLVTLKKWTDMASDYGGEDKDASRGKRVESDSAEISDKESDEDLVKRVIEKARRRIDAAIQKTADNLRDPKNRRTASDIASLFRQPSKAAVELARAAEVYEAAIDEVTQILQRQRNLSFGKDTEGPYRSDADFDEQKRQAMGVQLTAEQLAIIAQLSGCAQSQRVEPCDRQLCFHMRYRSIDGSCNNLKYPKWGAALSPFYRLLPPVYENGVNQPVGWNPEKLYFGYPKPSARLVSYRLLADATKLQVHTRKLETFNQRIKMSLKFNNRSHDTSSPFDFPLYEKEELFDEDDSSSGMLMQWGQFLDHDLDFTPVDASTSRFSDGLGCNETCINDPPCFPILTPPGDPRIRQRCIGFARSSATCGSGSTSILLGRPQHREQLNQISAYLDASNVYGSEDFENSQLRDTLYDEGHLRGGMPTPAGKQLLPFNIRGQVDCQADPQQDFVPCFKAGDHRSNENLGLLSMHTIWMREHNRIADELRSLNPHWSGDRLYHEARKIVGALMQSITYRVWLPKVLGPRGMEMMGGETYPGYDSSVNPTISNEFATAAFRFGHTMVPPIYFRLNENWETIPEGHLLLHKAFFAPDKMLTDGGMDPILRGLLFHGIRDIIRRPSLNPELTERLFAMAHQLALDLASLNIQRGRDHGLQHYTSYAYKICGLGSSAAPDSFEDLADRIRDPAIREELRAIYGHPGNIDLFVGGVLEDVLPGARMGPTFACIIADQFKRLRAGDRLWYESPGLFTTAQLAEIRDAGSYLSRVICENGDNITEVPLDAFIRPKNHKDLVSCSQVPKLNLALWKECPSLSGASFGSYSDIGIYFDQPLNRRRRSVPSEDSCEAKPPEPLSFMDEVEQELEARLKLREHQLKLAEH